MRGGVRGRELNFLFSSRNRRLQMMLPVGNRRKLTNFAHGEKSSWSH